MPIDLLDELRWRGLIHQCTDEAGLRAHLAAGVRSIYAGFDPTADSVTIGNLVPLMMLVHVQRSGHDPVVVMGGGTGLIGDPSGKSAERQLMTEETVRRNVEGQRPIFERVFRHAAALEGRPARVPPILNNLDWLGKLGYLEALRDIGKHFSVNMMIQKDSVRARLHERDQGISYTEFSYMILQSYDFLVLFRDFARHGLPRSVTVQMGGSDQWGNIVAGADLIGKDHARRVSAWERQQPPGPVEVRDPLFGAKVVLPVEPPFAPPTTFGLTTPLVTKADGTKFGKTESGAIWLSAPAGPGDTSKARTSAYAYYQFWLNASDADAARYLRIFTLLPRERIEAIEAEHARDPGQRLAQRELARAATALLHGPEAVEHAESAARALFSGDIAGLPESTLREALAEAPSSTHSRALLSAATTNADGSTVEGIGAADLVALTTLVKEHSKSEARQLVKEGSISVNGRKIGPQDRFTPRDLLHGSILAVRRGKKAWHLLKWE